MFEPFFTTKREGTGLGLSICRSIVEAHDGVLCATRKEAPGSVFQFTVPLIHPPTSIQT
jgi:signal transduction histidine kinase